MDNLGSNQKPKDIDKVDLSKTDKRFGRHDFEATFFVVAVFLLFAYLLNFGTVNEAIGRFAGRCFWLIKPYSTIGFDKTPKIDNILKFVQINCAYSSSQPEDTNIAYDRHSIRILKSFQDIIAINTIDINGEINDVRCFFSDGLDWDYRMKRDSQIPIDRHGLYIYCLYSHDGEKRLSCHEIGQNDFERYEYKTLQGRQKPKSGADQEQS